MLWRRVGALSVVGVMLVPSCEPGCTPPPPPPPGPLTEIVAVQFEGTDGPWARLVDGDDIAARFAIGSLEGATLEGATVTFVGTDGQALVGAAELRQTYGLPSAAFAVEAVPRATTASSGFTFIGDSLGVSITDASPELPMLLDGVFVDPRFDSVGGRCTDDPGCRSTGVDAAQLIPPGSTTVTVVELGTNDASGSFATKIDTMMGVLLGKGVETVVWTTASTRSDWVDDWAVRNNAELFAATERWPQLVVVDWNAYSSGNADGQDGWFTSDQIHLTRTGQVHLARFLRDAIVSLVPPPEPPPDTTLPAP